ncbi:MAG: efflux RND transporter periplasmic adaptor subunit [Pseudomonadota bacterium]
MAKKRQIRWGWVVAVAVVALAIVGGIVSEATKKVPIRAATATLGSIAAYVEERARTSLPHIYHITMPMQGRVLPIAVLEGEEVKTGDIVVRLEDIDLQETALQVKDIVLAMDNWRKAAEAEVNASKNMQAFAQWEYEKDQTLVKKSAVSERQERDSKRRYLDSNLQIESSQAMFHATVAFQSIVHMLPSYVTRELIRTQVRSPVDGTVLKRHVWNEKVMTPGEPLLDIGDLSKLEVTADILTEEAARVQPGDRVEIFGDALGHAPVQGSVRLVEPEAFKKVSSLGVEEQRVAVKIAFAKGTLEELNQSGRSLGLSYRVRVRLITDEKKNALSVPRTALFRGIDGGWQVYRVNQGKASLTPVTVGLMNDQTAEIISGVAAGEKVIIAPESSISDGTRVESMD